MRLLRRRVGSGGGGVIVGRTGKPDGPLSREQWRALVAGWLAAGNQPLAFVRRKYPATVRRAVDLGVGEEELQAAVRYGLMRAARLFDPSRRVKFGTFAMPHLRACVQREYRRCTRDLDRLGGRKVVHGHAPVVDDGGEHQTVFDLHALAPASCCPAESADVRAAVRRAVALHLPLRYQRVVTARWGLDGSGVKTLRQVAAAIGVSWQRAHQIQVRAFELLRPHLSRLDWEAAA